MPHSDRITILDRIKILVPLGVVIVISAALLSLLWSSPPPVAGHLCRTGQAPRLDAHGTLMICQGGAIWAPKVPPKTMDR